jgi:acetyltransferase
MGDVAIRSAPVGARVASEMIDDLVVAELLNGYRGAPPVDREELGRIIVALGGMVASGRIAEIEINPLRVTAGGLVALDAVVIPRTNERGAAQ